VYKLAGVDGADVSFSNLLRNLRISRRLHLGALLLPQRLVPRSVYLTAGERVQRLIVFHKACLEQGRRLVLHFLHPSRRNARVC